MTYPLCERMVKYDLTSIIVTETKDMPPLTDRKSE